MARDSTSGVGFVHGTQTPADRGRPPRSCRAASPRRDRTAPGAQVEPGLVQDQELDLLLSASRLKGFSSSRILPTRCDCQASGSSGSSSRASSSHNRPKTIATASGSVRSASSSSSRPRKSRATDEPTTPAARPDADPHEQRRYIQAFHTVRHSSRSAGKKVRHRRRRVTPSIHSSGVSTRRRPPPERRRPVRRARPFSRQASSVPWMLFRSPGYRRPR